MFFGGPNTEPQMHMDDPLGMEEGVRTGQGEQQGDQEVKDRFGQGGADEEIVV